MFTTTLRMVGTLLVAAGFVVLLGATPSPLAELSPPTSVSNGPGPSSIAAPAVVAPENAATAPAAGETVPAELSTSADGMAANEEWSADGECAKDDLCPSTAASNPDQWDTSGEDISLGASEPDESPAYDGASAAWETPDAGEWDGSSCMDLSTCGLEETEPSEASE